MAYEAGVRTFAPIYLAPVPERRCDEWVGRYCLLYDSGSEHLPPEPARLRQARDTAIAVLKRAFALMPANSRLAQPLVRDLVQAGQPAAALEIARTHARARPDDPEADMLLGYALHFDRRTEEALAAFSRWLESLPPDRQHHIVRTDWLLQPAVRKHLAEQTPAARARADSLVWRYADPLFLTPGNELLADHLARNALALMHAEAPRVWNQDWWGEDSEQLMIRFGEWVLTTRSAERSALGAESFSEHWDPLERTYFPPDPSGALALKPQPDTIWPIDSLTARSGHTPPTIRVMRVLEHQAAEQPGGEPKLIVLGRALADSAVRPHGLIGAVFVLDSSLSVLRQASARVVANGDSILLKAEVPLSAAARFYSAEVYDTISRFAARARYALQPADSANGYTLSGLLLSRPDSAEHPLLRPVIASGTRFGIYSELTGSGVVALQLETRSIDHPGVPVRVAHWLGRRFGIESPGRPVLGWSVELTSGKPEVIALAVDPGELKPGHYVVRLTATPEPTGKQLVAERVFVVSGR